MFKSLRKAAHSLSSDVQSTFSSASATQTAHTNAILTFPNHTVRLGPVFAEGGFSYLHTASPHPSPSTRIRYAVKRLAYPSTDPELRRQIDAEISLLSSIPPHPNVVTFHGSTTTSDTAFLLFDLIDGGTLPELLKRTPQLHPTKLVAILSDIAAAIAHFHSQLPPISIRDVKLENILYDRLKKSYKLCDLGSASTFAGIHSTRQQILRAEEEIANSCTAMYRAPELADLYTKQFICERIDVWALGCVWHALLYAALPFDGMSTLQITNGLQSLPPHPPHPPQFKTWLRDMLTLDPAQRCDIFHVLESTLQWQRKPMDPTMRDAAQRLRALRRRDFARGNAKAPHTTLVQSRVGGLRETGEELLTSGGGAQDASLAVGKGIGNRGVMGSAVGRRADGAGSGVGGGAGGFEGTEDGGWADFESAFGTAAVVGEPGVGVSMKSKDAMDRAQGNSGIREGSGRGGVDGGLLIDFGDMRIGGVATGRGKSAGALSEGDHVPSAGEAGQERDLIDFG